MVATLVVQKLTHCGSMGVFAAAVRRPSRMGVRMLSHRPAGAGTPRCVAWYRGLARRILAPPRPQRGTSPSATSLFRPSAVVVRATVVGVAGRCRGPSRIGVRDMLSQSLMPNQGMKIGCGWWESSSVRHLPSGFPPRIRGKRNDELGGRNDEIAEWRGSTARSKEAHFRTNDECEGVPTDAGMTRPTVVTGSIDFRTNRRWRLLARSLANCQKACYT